MTAIDAVKAMYTQATTKLPSFLEACQSEEEKAEVWAEYYALRKNFDDCVNRTFEENDPELMQLELEAEASAQQIARLNAHLQGIVKTLGTLSTAVGYGVKIAAKVVAV